MDNILTSPIFEVNNKAVTIVVGN